MKALLVSLCLLFPVLLRAQVVRSATITDTEKLYGLSTFWSEAKYNFAYFDKAKINWDSAYRAYIPQVLATKNDFEYYRTLERFCALLKDGHTNINGPWSLYQFSTYVPFRWTIIDQKPYVSRVLKGLSDSVPVGSELLTVNGQPIRQYLEQQVFPYVSASAEHEKWNSAMFRLWSATADTTTIYPMTLRTPAGKVIAYNSRLFSQRERNGSAWINGDGSGVAQSKLSSLTMLPGDIARVELNSFGNEKIVDEFKAMLPQLRMAKGIILDIRQNGGGNTGNGAAILYYFTEQKELLGSAWRTREHRAAYKAWGTYALKEAVDSARLKTDEWYVRSAKTAQGDFWYKADVNTFENDATGPKLLVPTVILAGNSTGSAAEDMLILVKQLKTRKIPIIGAPSTGSTGQPLPFDMPGGGSARICTKRDTYADGSDFVGIGVLPDIEVKPTVADVISGKDIVLERAVTYLQGRK
ncbi:S41 family peptidase [Fibrella forsythiae]|uniref:Peptidase S41 n=1 Tax=Fibrella forsythiae TaxID=2817061 RepID=A0ABS3JP04_9BACT|nr:S41 family peptidase [Fibrella forsythiae]MBO0951724.1 peptidase S41 [Fibrella forsythiae]